MHDVIHSKTITVKAAANTLDNKNAMQSVASLRNSKALKQVSAQVTCRRAKLKTILVFNATVNTLLLHTTVKNKTKNKC